MPHRLLRSGKVNLANITNIQLATRVSDEQARQFKAYTAALGTTPSDAMRILIAAFNQNKGFPCEISLKASDVAEEEGSLS